MSDPNTNPLFYANYKISKVFSTTSFNQTTKKDSKYISYQCFDEDNYPLLIMLSIDKSHCYFHYFWSSSENVYLKSEKITLSKITKNNFIDRKSN